MTRTHQFYIGGEWVDPIAPSFVDVINPATEEPVATLAIGTAADVDRAVAAAKRPSSPIPRRRARNASPS